MDEATAARRRDHGLTKLQQQERAWQRREDYHRGKQDLPYAPDGVNEEYLALRKQAGANWLPLPIGAPVQRCMPDGFRTGRDQDADEAAWNEVFQPNKLDARLPVVFTQSMVHGRGVMSVSANPLNRRSPKVRVESSKRVSIEPDPDHPFEPLYAVKRVVVADQASSLWTPNADGRYESGDLERAYVYDANEWVQWERRALGGAWTLAGGGRHDLGYVPFVPFDVGLDGDAVPHSALEPLMPQQDAINTIRFNVLLAMQYSAFRQRVFTGYDPVVRDAQGNPVFEKNEDGSLKTDRSGRPVPQLNSPGRIGVDRALVLPGADSKVFDLAESNLNNYVVVLTEFLTQLFATGQVPPQYLLTKMANLSGDALAGAESTLKSLVQDLQRGWGESLEQVMRLANRARGEDEPDVASEVIWADSEARSFAQVVDGIVKLTTAGFPEQGAWEMLPGYTPTKGRHWRELAAAQRAASRDAVLGEVLRPVV